MHRDTTNAPAGTIPLALQVILGAAVFCTTFTIAGSQTAFGLSIVLWIFFGLRGAAAAPRRTMLDVPLALFVAAVLAAALFSAERLESLSHLKNLLLITVVYIVAFLAGDPKLRRRLFALLLVSGAGSAIYGIVLYLLGRGRGTLGRTHGSFSTAMTFGGILLILSSLFLAQAVGSGASRRLRIASALAALAAVAALFYTFTRSSWVGAIVSVVVILALLRRRLLVPFAVCLVLFVVLLPGPYRARVASIWDPTYRTNVQRLELLRGGAAIFKEHPVIGVGTMDLADVYRDHMPPGAVYVHGHMHNDFVQIAVQMGIVGLAAFVVLLLSFFRLMARNLKLDLPPGERAFVVGSIAALAGFIVNGLFEWNFGDAEVVTLLYVIIGANLALALEHLRARC
ncbi:MAG: O-antigen ligase family protein [Candidatus Krumholzibacteriaceae bacterium]